MLSEQHDSGNVAAEPTGDDAATKAATPQLGAPGVPPLPRQAARAPAPGIFDINLARLHQMGMVTRDGGRTSVAEDFRIIKRVLLRNATAHGNRHGNLIVVTSALPGEGKTYCAVNLAMSIAMEMDITVLLVDADVARPSLLQVLGLGAEAGMKAGLMDILLDDAIELADVIVRTNVPTLSILPAGRRNKHANELLASHAMRSLLADIASRYADRIVIFDSPPLLPTTEATVLASQMGQVVLVVEAETTTQHAVKEALRKIEGCSNIGLIYNKTTAFPDGEQYGYYE
jgi:exopolysaccharide/PEP-CTERM locus tyrosine autokinase